MHMQAAEAVGEAVTLRRLLDESRSASEQDEVRVSEPAEPQHERGGQAGLKEAPLPAALEVPAETDAPAPAMRDSPQGTSQRSWARERLLQQVRHSAVHAPVGP